MSVQALETNRSVETTPVLYDWKAIRLVILQWEPRKFRIQILCFWVLPQLPGRVPGDLF